MPGAGILLGPCQGGIASAPQERRLARIEHGDLDRGLTAEN